MMINVFSDLDKTLLRTDGTISPYSKSVFNNLKQKINLIFVTARSFEKANFYYSLLDCHTIICNNGADIYSQNHFIRECNITNALETLVKIYNKYPYINISINTSYGVFSNFPDGDAQRFHSIFDLELKNAKRILLCDVNYEIFKDIYQTFSNKYYVAFIENRNVMITNKNATKESAVYFVQNQPCFCNNTNIGFGDDINDIKFLQQCDISIGMENSIFEVKKNVMYICDSNDNDGVAKWLVQYFEKEEK